MAKNNRVRDIIEFAALFFLLYFVTNFALKHFFPETFAPETVLEEVTVKPLDATVKDGHHPILVIRNNTPQEAVFPPRCPEPPVNLSHLSGGDYRPITSTENAVPCVDIGTLAPGEKFELDLSPWKYSLLSEYGEYQAEVVFSQETEGTEETEETEEEGEKLETVFTQFSIHEAGFFTQVFRAFVTKPLLNLLVFIASVMPEYSLGFAIILLTLVVKIVLFFPTQHGMESQKKLQLIQPRLNAIKEKYKDDPKKMQQETMKVWKEEKINPFQSCMPILIQFPVLIGLFFVIRDGSVLELSKHLLYAPYQDLTWSYSPDFFGMDLLKPSVYLFPPLLVALQFSQMKLTFANAKKRKKDKQKDLPEDKLKQQQIQQKMMLYGLPLMIGIFAIQFPAAVSLYWGVSTVFAIGQQLVVNRKSLGQEASKQ